MRAQRRCQRGRKRLALDSLQKTAKTAMAGREAALGYTRAASLDGFRNLQIDERSSLPRPCGGPFHEAVEPPADERVFKRNLPKVDAQPLLGSEAHTSKPAL
jgi:hypothetical protein